MPTGIYIRTKYHNTINSLSQKGIQVGSKNAKWKGNNVGYVALHTWLNRVKRKKTKCKFCGEENKRLEWANISGKHKRDKRDYTCLCVKCHRNYDLDKRGRKNNKLKKHYD